MSKGRIFCLFMFVVLFLSACGTMTPTPIAVSYPDWKKIGETANFKLVGNWTIKDVHFSLFLSNTLDKETLGGALEQLHNAGYSSSPNNVLSSTWYDTKTGKRTNTFWITLKKNFLMVTVLNNGKEDSWNYSTSDGTILMIKIKEGEKEGICHYLIAFGEGTVIPNEYLQ